MYEKFEKLLKERDVTPYRVYKETGISTATLSDWKNGKSQPKKDKIEKLCEYFNVPLSYFYGNDETSKQELHESTYNDLIMVYTRNRKNLSQEEKMRLARIILSNDED